MCMEIINKVNLKYYINIFFVKTDDFGDSLQWTNYCGHCILCDALILSAVAEYKK